MAQPQATEQLKAIIAQTLSPDANIRKNAESQLGQAKKSPGHARDVLALVASSNAADMVLRQAAAVHFKNLVKVGWDVNHEDGNDGIVIPPEDRVLIKRHLLDLMGTMPPQIKAQLSAAIVLIAAVDFPKNWDTLLPDSVQRLNSPDTDVVIGVLQTLDSVFQRFRHVQRSDDLYAEILYVLKHLQAPLLTLFQTTGQAVEAYRNDPEKLKPRLSALRFMCQIFYSLNYQDLPEYFEDNMAAWMTEFAKYLQYQNPLLVDNNEEEEPSPVDSLQAAIVDNLYLYADKDEEPFLPFLPQFTTLVWNLLLNVTALPKHDTLATTSIRFLSSLVQKLMHRDLFKQQETLRQIVSKIVIQNIMIREVDEERFEDDPQEFIVTDIESGDSDSRRRWSQDLLRAMCRQFEPEVTAICSEHVGTMLAEYAADPANQWKCKDVAIQLMMGIAIRAESAHGVSQVNESVNVMEFFTTHILPELQDTNHSVRPMVKAMALKFVCTFRNQFSREQLTSLMSVLISHLASPVVVVHTYAAYTIERILTTKQTGADGVRREKFGSEQLRPFLESLFTALFLIIENTQWNENAYAMKCVMRSLSVAKQDIVSVTAIVLQKLTAALGRVAKNPRNPQYNHYMFESIAVLVRFVCSADPALTASFETLLFPPFQTVLHMDIVEFTPYVFQVLAQILEYRPRERGLGNAYTSLFLALLSPMLWERKGNVPALTRLVTAYLMKAGPDLVPHVMAILGVFQKLISVPAHEVSAFELLGSITQYIPADALNPRLQDILRLLMMRLNASKGKKGRLERLATQYFALLVGKSGAQLFVEKINGIQSGLTLNLILQVWLPRLQKDPPSRLDAKVQVVGLTKLLCSMPELLADENGKKLWADMLASVVALLASPSSAFGNVEHADNIGDVEIGYDATFSGLHFAKKPAQDPFADIADPTLFFVQTFHRFRSENRGGVQPILQQGRNDDPKLLASLGQMFQKAGLNLEV